MCVQSLSHIQLFVTPRTVACQAPLSMGFSRQEYWSGLSFPSPGKQNIVIAKSVNSLKMRTQLNLPEIEESVMKTL